MDIFDLCVVGVIGAIIAITLKETRAEIAVMVSLVTGIVLLLMITLGLSSFIGEVKNTLDNYNVPGIYLATVLKVMGISYITEFASYVCKDAGETATAGKILLGGRVMIAALTVPVMKSIVEKICGVLA